jgi:general secretion pathway protein H
MVVLVVAGLILALAPPLISKAVPSLRAKQAVRDLVSGLRLARTEAVRRGTETTLEIDLEARTLTVPAAGKTRYIPEDLDLTVTTAAEDSQGAEQAAFRFFPDGTATGGNVVLETSRLKYQVSVDWLTGRIHAVQL